MTWGSNPTFQTVPCRFCGMPCIDDKERESTHELGCEHRTWWRRFLHAWGMR